jgi:hypothetical protein
MDWLFCVSTVHSDIHSTAELHLTGLIGTASHPDMQKIRIFGFFFENRLHQQFEVSLLVVTVCTCI